MKKTLPSQLIDYSRGAIQSLAKFSHTHALQGFLALILAALSTTFWLRVGVPSVGFLDEDFMFLMTGTQGPRRLLLDLAIPHAIGTFRPWGHQMHFLLGRMIFGLRAERFHWLELTLHLANTALVFRLFYDFCSSRWSGKIRPPSSLFIAGIAATAWSIQSSFSPSVAWIAATNNTWFLLFFLIFLHGFLRQWRTEPLCFLFVMALLSKEFAILALPVALCFSNFTSLRRQKNTILWIAVISVLYLAYLAAVHVQYPGQHHFEISSRSFEAYESYLSFIKVGFYRGFPTGHSAWLYLGLLIICCAWLGGLRPLLLYIGGLLFLSCWPYHVRAEFLYLPLVGLFGALTALCSSLFARLRLGPYWSITGLCVLSFFLYEYWLDNAAIAKIFVGNIHQRSEVFRRSEPLLLQLPQHIEETDQSSYWQKLNTTLGERGIIFTYPFLQVMNPEIFARFPCFARFGVDMSKPLHLTPDVFQRCEGRPR